MWNTFYQSIFVCLILVFSISCNKEEISTTSIYTSSALKNGSEWNGKTRAFISKNSSDKIVIVLQQTKDNGIDESLVFLDLPLRQGKFNILPDSLNDVHFSMHIWEDFHVYHGNLEIIPDKVNFIAIESYEEESNELSGTFELNLAMPFADSLRLALDGKESIYQIQFTEGTFRAKLSD